MTAISSTQPPQVDPHLPTFLRQALLADEEQLRRDYSNNAGRSTTSDKIAIDDETYPRDIIHTDVRSPHALLVPPLNFQNVTHGISRSGHPNERNYEFIRRLRLKSIMYVANEDYRPSISKFAEQEGIQILHHRLSVNKEPFGEMEEEIVASALSQLLDTRNHPILVHCNKGKYRVGCLIGLLRRLQGWSHTSIFEEFARFAGTKAVDEEFIEVFDLSRIDVDPAFVGDEVKHGLSLVRGEV